LTDAGNALLINKEKIKERLPMRDFIKDMHNAKQIVDGLRQPETGRILPM
jgi:hypothetical protein